MTKFKNKIHIGYPYYSDIEKLKTNLAEMKSLVRELLTMIEDLAIQAEHIPLINKAEKMLEEKK
jgi:hypothetical protein